MKRHLDLILIFACLCVFLFFPYFKSFYNKLVPLESEGKPVVQEVMRMAQPLGPYTKHFKKKTRQVEGERKHHMVPYLWFEPARPYPENLKFPLVLVLHGASGRMNGVQYLITKQMRVSYPAFILAPMFSQGSIWAAPHLTGVYQEQNLPTVVQMVKDLMQEHPIDPKRIYVMGCSDGGTGAFGAANYYPDVFSAAVSHIGTWIPMKAPDMTKVPIWAFHGGKDEVFPYQRTKAVIDAIRQNGGEAHFSYFEDMGHSCNGKFLYPEELWIWMFKQQKDE